MNKTTTGQLEMVKSNPGVYVCHDWRMPHYEVLIVSKDRNLHPILIDTALSDEGWSDTITFRKLNTRFDGIRPTAGQRLQLAEMNAASSDHMTQLRPEEMPPSSRDDTFVSAWRSKRFLAQVYREANGSIRISVCRSEWDLQKQSWREDISWDDLMQIKQQIGYSNAWAYECFPPEVETINVANMRHLFIPSEQPTFGWRNDERKSKSA